MARFDVYRNPRRGQFPLLLDVQAELLSTLATRVVVPMAMRKSYRAKPITSQPIVAASCEPSPAFLRLEPAS